MCCNTQTVDPIRESKVESLEQRVRELELELIAAKSNIADLTETLGQIRTLTKRALQT